MLKRRTCHIQKAYPNAVYNILFY